MKSYKNRMGMDGLLICSRSDSGYRWKNIDGSPTIGEEFDPAKDCSDIVDNLPDAKDGFYWISLGKNKVQKAWCDVHTDGGGFILLGKKNSPVIWTVPSSTTPVDPSGPAHFSNLFGNFDVQDFSIQISTSKRFDETKAHWLYRLNPKRKLGNLFGVARDRCTDVHSGIGNVSYVKDILTDTIVTKKFKCSKFGPHANTAFGWVRMNYCLQNNCPKGYAFIKGIPYQLDSFGSFSYSAVSPMSGITHNSTAFVGCDNKECCACYGPKGGRGNYCGKVCTAINGGTVTKQAHVWFWIRTRTPKRLWKRCMQFQKENDDGKLETFFVDQTTGSTHKGSCSKHFNVLLNEGTLTVSDKSSFEKIPPVPGLLAYRPDKKQFYVNNGSVWKTLGIQRKELNVIDQLKKRIKNLEKKVTLLSVLPQHVQCSGYTWLNESSRNQNSKSAYNCDQDLSGWYRFGGGAGTKIATSCVSPYACGSHATGWMSGAHPTVADGKVTRKVCYSWSTNCCTWFNNIEVVNCGEYYVYQLMSTSPHHPCHLVYCGSDN